jgi:hypothetical protein
MFLALKELKTEVQKKICQDRQREAKAELRRHV